MSFEPSSNQKGKKVNIKEEFGRRQPQITVKIYPYLSIIYKNNKLIFRHLNIKMITLCGEYLHISGVFGDCELDKQSGHEYMTKGNN